MCENWREDKAKLLNDSRYSIIFGRATGEIRELGINKEMPGFSLLVQACCIKVILGYEKEEDIFDLLEKVTVIPSISPIIKDIRPEEQWLKEALRSSGIYEDVCEFVSRLSKKILKEM